MIDIKDLVKKYHSGQEEIIAANKVCLRFENSGFYIILGKSGCGKTTLLNVLAGLDDFDSGKVVIDGCDLKSYNESEFDEYHNIRIGIIFQQYNLLSDLNVYDNLRLVLELQEWEYKDAVREEYIRLRIEHILDLVGLPGFEKRRVNQLSGGEQQRIAIARTLLKNPNILFADEPTGNVDQKTGMQILELLKELSKDRLVIMVTHDKESAYRYGDHIVHMSDGSISKVDELDNRRYVFSFTLRNNEDRQTFHNLSINEMTKELERILYSCDNGTVVEISNLRKTAIDEENHSEKSDKTRMNNTTKRFSTWYKAQLAFAFLRKRRIRFLFTVVLTSLTMILMFFSLYIYFYNKEDVIVDYMKKKTPAILPIYTTAEYIDDFYVQRSIDIRKGSYFGSVIQNSFSGTSEIGRYLLDENLSAKDLKNFGMTTVVFLDDMNDLALEMEGVKPNSSDEIILTDYIANKLELKIGDEVEYSGCLFILSGIIKTDYSESNIDRKLNYGYSDEFFVFRCKYYYFSSYLLSDALNRIKLTDSLTLKSADFMNASKESDYLNSFMSLGSLSGLTEDDLKAGRFPIKTDEIVVSENYLRKHRQLPENAMDKQYQFKDIYADEYANFYSSYVNMYDYYPTGLKIVGVIEDESDGITKDVYIDDGVWNQVLSDYYLKYTGSYALFPTSGEYKKLVSLSKENDVFFDEPAVNNIYFFDKTIKSLKPILLIILIIVMAINFIMVGTFVNISISENRRNIGILRSLGVTMKDCTHIFNYEFYAIYVGSNIFATIVNILLVYKVNEFFSKGLKDVRYDIITFNLLICLIVALLEFLISYISVKIPIRKLSRQKPLEILADSDPS